MWEWRWFQPLGETSPLDELGLTSRFKGAPLERRVDYYYQLDLPQHGLKERWQGKPGQLRDMVFELKIRKQTLSWGAELWQKCIKLPTIPLHANMSKGEILQSLQASQDTAHDECDQAISAVHLQIQQQEDVNSLRIPIIKRRKQIWYQQYRDLMIEHVTFKVEGKEWESISLESWDYSGIKQFVDDYDLYDKPMIAGYPAFLCDLV